MIKRRIDTRIPQGMLPSTMPLQKLRAISSGDGKTHGFHSPSLDAPSHATSRIRRNSARRRLPRIVDLLTHDLFDFGSQLAHDAADVVGDVALAVAWTGERDGLVELD